jgi:hypothetical protein
LCENGDPQGRFHPINQRACIPPAGYYDSAVGMRRDGPGRGSILTLGGRCTKSFCRA